MDAPESEYQRRLVERRRRVEFQKKKLKRLGNSRLAYAAVSVALVWLLAAQRISWWPALALAALGGLIGLLIWGERLERHLRFSQRAVDYYERGLERVRNRRNEHAETGERFLTADHPYAADLDLFGKHSLFQLLSVCRTRAGEDRLARWLLQAATREEIGSRHEALGDLRDGLDAREDIAILGEDLRSGIHPDALKTWAAAAPIRIPDFVRYAARVLAAAGLFILIGWIGSSFNVRWRIALIAVLLIEAAIFFRWREVVSCIVVSVEEPGHDLALLAGVLARMEQESFSSPRLAALTAALRTPQPASRAIGKLNRLIELLDSSDNWLLRIIGPLILWTTQVSFAVETWRQRYGPAIPLWLDAAAEWEALSSLAALRYEHPEDVLPEIVGESALWSGEDLVHPLLPQGIANSVSLGPNPRLLIVSGSNMSGKSTLLRTVGLNTVLALAGAPVRAASLRLSVVSLGASIRTSDSLDAGISRFYAEILRIRQILDLAPPALFLLDELLAGTNSHDRRIGAEAILRALLERGAMGLATTHDLALTAIAEAAPNAFNVHFEDFIENGEVRFDYRMRPGVVTRSNALELMRSVGLNV